ncbi:MAG: SPOR domain-containing protein [Candidatus Omnitrophota bacterium]
MKTLRIIFICLLFICTGANAFAEDVLGKAKVLFLQKQYWQTIEECTAVINANSDQPQVLAQANYFAGASYVNLFDFLTAKKNFKVIVEKYTQTPYFEDAYLGLGDVEFLQENFDQALKVYEDFLTFSPSSKRRATLYFRLAEVYLRTGNEKQFQAYYGKLQQEFPLSFEARDARRLSHQADGYTVQVGAFTNYDNAKKTIAALKAKGYDVYSVLCLLSGQKLCRIRVGRCASLKDAELLKDRLELEGYPAKIFPRE